MRKKCRPVSLFTVIVLLVFCASLYAEWEEKKKYHYVPDGKKTAPTARDKKLAGLKKSLAPYRSAFEIETITSNQVTAERGTRLSIPANAFVDGRGRPVAGKVSVRVTVDLTYFNEKDRREFFQSAGMFRVDAAVAGDEPVALAPGKKIGIEFPNVVPGDEFWVYRHDANMQWKRHGHNQQGEGSMFSVGTRRYSIDALNTWWNFDKPLPEIACAQGRVQWRKDAGRTAFTVHSVGISYKGSFARRKQDLSSFRVNVHKASIARFLVIDTSGRIGITPPVSVWNKTGFDRAEDAAKNVCQDIGTIEVAAVDETIASDKKRLSEFLGLEVREYRVNYDSPTKPVP